MDQDQDGQRHRQPREQLQSVADPEDDCRTWYGEKPCAPVEEEVQQRAKKTVENTLSDYGRRESVEETLNDDKFADSDASNSDSDIISLVSLMDHEEGSDNQVVTPEEVKRVASHIA